MALISDLFDVLTPSSMGQNLTFEEKLFMLQGTKLPNWQNLQR
jgi:hypothetical protein